MIAGHGDDAARWPGVEVDFASNVLRADHSQLFAYLREQLPLLSRYPEADCRTAEQAVADYHGVRAEEALLTAGATAAVYLIAQAWRGGRSHILQPTFAEYADACRLHGHEMVESAEAADLVWRCQPNNPTGSVDAESLLEDKAFRTSRSATWILDHSYAAFTTRPLLSAREAVRRGDVLIMHSLTKRFGLPGLRMGYVVGAEALIARVRAQRMPWSVGALAQGAVGWLLSHEQLYPIDAEAISRERRRVSKALEAMGIAVCPSDCHMLLCRLPEGESASELKGWLLQEHGLLIRDASNFAGLTAAHFRIALQRREENDRLLRALSCRRR